MKVEIWSDIACPWCFIGLNRFQSALDHFEHADQVSVQLRSFQLDPSLPTSFDGSEAEYLAASKGIDPARAVELTGQVADVAAQDGLRLDFDALVVANSRRAHRLLHLATSLDATGATAWTLKQALFRAHFSEGQSIWDAETLTRIADGTGLPADAVAAALDSPELDAEVSADIDRATQLGIHAVPTFVFEGAYGVSGAQSVETFASALTQMWEKFSPAPLLTIPDAADGAACGVDGCEPPA